MKNPLILLAVMLTFLVSGAPGMVMALEDNSVVNVEINKGTLVKLNRPASSVVISDPNTADVQVISPKLVLVRGKKIGETSFYAIDNNDDMIVDAVVNVTHNISALERAVKRAAPDSDVGFKTVDGGLVMDGFANNTAESENIRSIAATYMGGNDKLVNLIKTNGSDQVMLKVKFVEMSRNDLKQLGINLQNVTSHGNTAIQFLQGNNILFNTATPGTDAFSTFNHVLARSNTDSNFMLRYRNLAGVVDALETDGLATVLAEPTLTTTSGQAASFLAGGQFPIPVVQASSGSSPTVTIQYQPFGVSLNFTPVVINKDHISLTVAPEVSTLDFSNPIQVSGVTYPILDDRKASAVVELGSGDSFMLAGLMKSNTSNNINKTPALGDIPILGALFRSTQFQNDQTELVILVTPYIVHPVASANKLQTPIDGYKPPSDLQMLLTGSLYRQQSMGDDDKSADENTNKKSSSMPALHGEGGFILE